MKVSTYSTLRDRPQNKKQKDSRWIHELGVGKKGKKLLTGQKSSRDRGSFTGEDDKCFVLRSASGGTLRGVNRGRAKTGARGNAGKICGILRSSRGSG